MTTINDLTLPASLITPAFTWNPPFVANVPITFAATTMIEDPTGRLSVVEYRWAFGDGTVGYGNPVTHTYLFTNPFMRTTLRVTDSKGRYWFTQAAMYSFASVPVSAGVFDPSKIPFYTQRSHYGNTGTVADDIWNLPTEATRHSMWCGQGFASSKLSPYRAASSQIKGLLYKNSQNVDFTNLAAGSDPRNPSGVSVGQCNVNPSWQLLDGSGNPILNPLDTNFRWQDPGNVSYQNAWATNVLTQLLRDGWDGLFLDDCNMDCFNMNVRPALYPTDLSYQTAIRAFIANVAGQIRAAGFTVICNIGGMSSPIRITTLQDWLTLIDGCMDEGWMRSQVSPTEALASLADTHWSTDLTNLTNAENAGKFFVCELPAYATDSQAIAYGLGTMLLVAAGHALFDVGGFDAPSGAYSQETFTADMLSALSLGVASGAYSRTGPSVTNLVTNPSVENGLTGFSANTGTYTGSSGGAWTRGTGTLSQDATVAYDDTNSAKFLGSNVTNQGLAFLLPGTFLSGHTYRFAAYFRNGISGGGRASQLFMGPSQGGDSATLVLVGGVADTFDLNGNRIWTRYELAWTPASDHTNVYVGYMYTVATGQYVNVDGWMVWEGASGWAWGDGDQQGNSWTGTPDNSSSTVINPQAYYRQFAGGFAVVNPYAVDGSIDLSTIGGGAHTFSGSGFAHVSAFTLPTLHGAILIQDP